MYALLLAFSLSVDALGIGLSYGLRRIRFPPISLLLLALEAFLAMELFLAFGRLLAAVIPAGAAAVLSGGFLLLFGAWLCLQGVGQGKEKEDSPLQAPSLCDRDASCSLEPKEALLLGLLLSLDSFAVGISAAVSGMDVRLLPLFSALLQSCFLALGAKGGRRLILCPQPKEAFWTFLSGGILILIALLQLSGQ